LFLIYASIVCHVISVLAINNVVGNEVGAAGYSRATETGMIAACHVGYKLQRSSMVVSNNDYNNNHLFHQNNGSIISHRLPFIFLA